MQARASGGSRSANRRERRHRAGESRQIPLTAEHPTRACGMEAREGRFLPTSARSSSKNRALSAQKEEHRCPMRPHARGRRREAHGPFEGSDQRGPVYEAKAWRGADSRQLQRRPRGPHEGLTGGRRPTSRRTARWSAGGSMRARPRCESGHVDERPGRGPQFCGAGSGQPAGRRLRTKSRKGLRAERVARGARSGPPRAVRPRARPLRSRGGRRPRVLRASVARSRSAFRALRSRSTAIAAWFANRPRRSISCRLKCACSGRSSTSRTPRPPSPWRAARP